MLQPALPTPAPATYGRLIDRAATAMREAIELNNAGFPDLLSAHEEVLGHERFLYVGGQHMLLLASFAPESHHLRALGARLTARPVPPSPGGRWRDAAVLLGTAHDLLATHVRGGSVALTPDAAQLLQRRDAGTDALRVLALLVEGAGASEELLGRATEAQATTPEPELIDLKKVGAVRRTARMIELHGKAAMWDVNSASGPGRLSTLEAATPTAVSLSREFESSLAALQALRQLAFRQRVSDDNLSAASLNDLTHLARAVTSADGGWLPRPATALQRVQYANARDHLTRANATWERAAQGLTTTIQSLTRAASPYGRAIKHLVADVGTPRPEVTGAVLAVLPRIAEDTVPAIGRLTSSGALIVAERPPASLSVRWRPLTTSEGDELADRFLIAASATAVASTAVRGLTQRSRPTTPSAQHHQHELSIVRQVNR